MAALLFYYYCSLLSVILLSPTHINCYTSSCSPYLYLCYVPYSPIVPYSLPCQSIRRKRGLRAGRRTRSRLSSEPIPVLSITPRNGDHQRKTIHFPARDSKVLRNISYIPQRNVIRFGLWNARSVNKKVVSISELVISNSLDLLVLTETWLKPQDHVVGQLLDLLPGYKITNQPRISRGGGLAVLSRSGLTIRTHTGVLYASFEYMDLIFTSGGMSIRVISIYRPPPSAKNMLSFNQFLSEFSDLVERLCTSQNKIIIAGDFNIHCDMVSNLETERFMDILETFDLNQHINRPTHSSGHTLDLVITNRSSRSHIITTSIFSDAPSDHSYIICDIFHPKAPKTRMQVSSRKLRDIQIESFIEDIQQADFGSSNDGIDRLVDIYNSNLLDILDIHAPKKCRTVTCRPQTQWYTDDLRDAKRELRRLERRLVKNRTTINRDMFKNKCGVYKTLLVHAKTAYYREKFGNCDAKRLFQLVKNLSSTSGGHLLPDSDSKQELATRFSLFFEKRIEAIRCKLDDNHTSLTSNAVIQTTTCSTHLSNFKPVTPVDIREILKISKIKSCATDPVPACILKHCLDSLVGHIVRVINCSISLAQFPNSLKVAMIIPSIKKPSLDTNTLANYRPIANLPFLSKIIEKAILMQLDLYLQNNNLYPSMQSGYRRFHSTETALIKIFNDICCALDHGKNAVLILLDLSCAFDTLDHEILIDRLRTRFGFTGNVLKWLQSYLLDRRQFVNISCTHSSQNTVRWGVPQGSVLGPLLFNLYLSPVEDIILAHGLSTMSYADDTQLYISLEPNNNQEAKTRLESCLSDLYNWFSANMLVCNRDKSNFIYFTSKFHNYSSSFSISFGSSVLHPVDTVRNLGVYWDKHLLMRSNISKCCQLASFSLNRIGALHNYVDKSSMERLVHAFISSRLDYCNALLYGLPDREINRLQKIQNAAARLISGTRKYDHIVPVLKSLHWLPVKARIKYKILLMTYRILCGCCPSYFVDLISFHDCPYNP